MKKVLVILGPTASGKSALAVKLAKKISTLGGPAYGWNGAEIISADSRQVYKGLDIGTGKITKKEMRGIKHYLLDVVSTKNIFTVADYKKLADTAIQTVLNKEKIPIICGGTGFYIQAIIDNVTLPEVKPNIQLRKKLEKKTIQELCLILKKLDPRRFKTIDQGNPRRLIRAIEIAKALGYVPKIQKNKSNFEILQIGIETRDIDLKMKIKKRLLDRIKRGMVQEVRNLNQRGVSWRRLQNFGLEYRYVTQYIQKKTDREKMIEKLNTEIWRYAKRQKTWFKKDKRIKWFSINEQKKIEKKIKSFLLK